MVLAEFEGSLLAKEATGDGDVQVITSDTPRPRDPRGPEGPPLALAEPEHLEAVDPVIEDGTREAEPSP